MSRTHKNVPQALPHIEAMAPYTPGEQPDGDDWLKLNTNENPYPPSPRIGEAIASELQRLPLYPGPKSEPLRQAIADFHRVDPAQALVGNGSDDVLNLLIRAFSDSGASVGMLEPGYSLYPILAGIQKAPVRKVLCGRDMLLETGKIAHSGAAIFFLTSPNAPTGVGYSRGQIAAILEEFGGLLVVDEAYAAFAREDAVPLLGKYPNLAITRTFSKSHGLAGLRVGYVLAAPEVIEILDRVRDSYNVNRLSQAGALAAFGDQEYYRKIIEKINFTRECFYRVLRDRNWFTYPSQANFLFTEPRNSRGETGAEVAENLFKYLRKRKILVRYFGGSSLTAGFLRISVGTDKQMNLLLEAIDSWINHAQQK